MSDSQGGGTALLAIGCAPLLVLASALLLVVLVPGDDTVCTPGTGGDPITIDIDSIPDTPIADYGREQLENAAHIMNAAVGMGMSTRDQQIGVMTAMGESSLRVLDEGDGAGPDSRGLFQQRDNGAWGSYEDRMDPTTSAMNFFFALMEIEDRESIEEVSLIAHQVQVNADPYHYAPYWGPAIEVVETLSQTARFGGPVEVSAQNCNVGGGGDPVLSDDCGPVSDPNLSASACNGYAAITAEFGDPWNGGVGCYDPRPWEDPPQDHPKGLACDYMVATADMGYYPDDATHQVAIDVVNWLITHHEELKISYVIYEAHIWNPQRDSLGMWQDVRRPMGETGDPTFDHFDHIHVSHIE